MICLWRYLEAVAEAYQAIVFERWADELARWHSCSTEA